ncbi:MAG: D-aminoacyl-tRNA deacylase [Pseudomonadales bacterium]
MKLLLQRVLRADVTVDGATIARIGPGLLVFVAIEPGDDESKLRAMADRILQLRIFPDDRLPMNLSVQDVDGEVLVVSQFTLAADTSRGRRPGFGGAAAPDEGKQGYERLIALLRERWPRIAEGRFGADMQVGLVNDGPATFFLSR